MWTALLETLALVSLAEIGDKSQLVAIALGARHRPLPVILGATVAFAALNALAVGVGAVLDVLLPEAMISGAAGLLFVVFGVLTLWKPHAEAEEVPSADLRGAFLAATTLLFVAELGDKTQLAVAALAGTRDPVGVWIGAMVGLVGLSALGVLLGQALLRAVPVTWVHRGAGVLFVVFGALALMRAASLSA